MAQIDWEPILWLLGAFGSIVVALLGCIVWFLIKHSNSLEATDQAQERRADKHEKWILKQQKHLSKLGKRTDTSIELIKAEQLNNNERLKVFENYLATSKKRI